MAQLQIAAHSVAAQVQIAIFHAQVVAAVAHILDGEGWGDARAEHFEGAGNDFDVARGHFGILVRAFGNRAHYLNHKFAAQLVRLVAQLGIHLVIKHDLREAIAVTQVHKGHAAHFAGALHPSGEGNALAHIVQAEFSACFRSVHSSILICLSFLVSIV